MANKIGSIFLLISLVCSFALLAYYANFTYNASKRYDEAQEKVQETQQEVQEARENLAQNYAEKPWTIEHITSDIDQAVQDGFFTASDASWLKERIVQLRSPR